MKKLKAFTALICCFLIVILPCCKGAEGSSTLKVGVSGLGGVFNPFYAQSNADREVVSQMFRSIQRKDGDNKGPLPDAHASNFSPAISSPTLATE